MTSLISSLQEKLKDKETAAAEVRQKLVAEYWGIIRRGRKPRPGDADRVLALVELLNLPQERVQRDLEAMEEALRVQDAQARVDALAADRQKAHEAFQAADDAWTAADHLRGECHSRIQNVDIQLGSARKDLNRLKELQQSRPELFEGRAAAAE